VEFGVGLIPGGGGTKEFALRIPPKGEMIKGFLGGSLMAIGATVGIGCSIGSFFSGVPALSGGALVFTFAMFAGVILSLKYLIWEMENRPGWSSGKSYTYLAVTPDKGRWQVILGFVVVVLIALISNSYAATNMVMAWFILISGLMGLISQRSRFCIVKAFRDP
ncbi:YeeE/YedE family protein, partial [bacterium]|nr:YeeE/YedE family protein [bacterium]